MIDNFSELIQVIIDGVHPEITNYQNLSHPGIGWYLKTVVPKRTHPNMKLDQLHDVIDQLCETYPTIIQVIPYAMNWEQELIDNAASVWIKDGMDISFKINDIGDLEYEIIQQNESIKRISKNLTIDLKNLYNEELDSKDHENLIKLNDIAQFLLTYTDPITCQELRKNIKVVKDDQI